jgi:hypothetical protein
VTVAVVAATFVVVFAGIVSRFTRSLAVAAVVARAYIPGLIPAAPTSTLFDVAFDVMR